MSVFDKYNPSPDRGLYQRHTDDGKGSGSASGPVHVTPQPHENESRSEVIERLKEEKRRNEARKKQSKP